MTSDNVWRTRIKNRSRNSSIGQTSRPSTNQKALLPGPNSHMPKIVFLFIIIIVIVTFASQNMVASHKVTTTTRSTRSRAAQGGNWTSCSCQHNCYR